MKLFLFNCAFLAASCIFFSCKGDFTCVCYKDGNVIDYKIGKTSASYARGKCNNYRSQSDSCVLEEAK